MEMNIFSSFIRFFESEIFLFNNKFGLKTIESVKLTVNSLINI